MWTPVRAGRTMSRHWREEVDVVLTSLPGPKEAEAVGDVLMTNMRKGTVWFDLSTNSPTVVRRLHAKLAQQGIAMFDAPVSGGPPAPSPESWRCWSVATARCSNGTSTCSMRSAIR